MANDKKTDITTLAPKLATGRGKVDLGRALKLRLYNHLSYSEIGKQFDVTGEAIRQALLPFKKFVENPEALTSYKNEKGAILEGVEMALLNNLLDEDKVKKATLGNVAYAFDKISQQGRLARGESTANINHHVLSQEVSELEAELEKIDAEMAS